MIACVLIVIAMAARSSSSAGLDGPPAKRLELLQEIQSVGKQTKTSTLAMLKILRQRGLLNCDVSERKLRDDMQSAVESVGNTMTPYGPVIQTVRLNAPGLRDWEICHPFAFLWYMSQHSAAFRKVMRNSTVDGRKLRLVIYMDGLVPGNPFRPDKGRSIMCIYWAFIDWPAFMLTRTFAWPCLSILRESIMEKIPGGASYLARIALRLFFPFTGDSLETGLVIKGPDESYLVQAKFVGFLADLKEHKTITEWKGTGGNVCCLRCSNVWNGSRPADGTIGLDCSDTRQFIKRTESQLRDIVATLNHEKTRMAKTNFSKLETDLGINYCPQGILFDTTLHGLYNPVDHTIVDWMHTLCSDGVANLGVWTVMKLLQTTGYSPNDVREFLTIVHLPSKYGKPDPAWLSDSRLHGTSWSSFSNVVCNVVPILYLFLDKFCTKDARLADVVKYMGLLYMIIGTLSSGPEEAPHHSAILERNMMAFHALHVKLTNDLKPKLHHMHHIVDGMKWLGKLVSCFVCERKHRHVKDSALYVFRHLEHTVLHDVVNKQCQQLLEGVELFKEQFLVRPHDVRGALGLRHSTRAVLKLGSCYVGDLFYLRGLRCGRVEGFYELGDNLFVQLSLYQSVRGAPDMFDERIVEHAFIDPDEVVDACTWFYDKPSIVKVAVPPLALLSRAA